MNIVFLDILNEQHNGEYEAMLRIEHVLQIQGHTLTRVNRYGFVIQNGRVTNQHVEDISADFFFTFDPIERAVTVYPDLYGAFVHWAPTGYFENYKALLYIQNLHSFDAFGYSSQEQLFSAIAGIPVEYLPVIGPSVPKDYAIPTVYMKQRRLFYIGINVERAMQSMRYGTLLKKLDETGQLDIYGPKCVYGMPNLWAGFSSYKGEVPFDSSSIITKIHAAGICLALNSPMHNDANAVTSRIYEGAAAGALLISDDNTFVRRHFGDSVFYLAPELPEEEASFKILQILEWANHYPEKAYEMAQKSQRAFLMKLSLDDMVAGFLESVRQSKIQALDVSRQAEVIDVICFVQEPQDFSRIMQQLEHQYFQKLHIIVAADLAIRSALPLSDEYDFVPCCDGHEGHALLNAKEKLQGSYFMFMDGNSILHARHIQKNYQILSAREELFCYSGCYTKHGKQKGRIYTVLNNKPILRDEFLLFAYTDFSVCSIFFHIESVFSKSCALFKTETLRYADNTELECMSSNVHLYLACAVLIKTGRLGRFTYAVTSGYAAKTVKEFVEKYQAYCNSDGINHMGQLRAAFAQYTYEVNPQNILQRNVCGSATWNEEEQPLFLQWKLTKKIKPFIPLYVKEFLRKGLISGEEK